MTELRTWARRVAYWSGALGFYRRRDVLTVLMFHRVISRADPNFSWADPAYTIEAEVFRGLLEFCREHFTIVSLDRVMDATTKSMRLPDCPLLITFDDGWADNLQHAVPILQSFGMPAVIFVVGEAVVSLEKSWWQEKIAAGARLGYLQSCGLSECTREDGSVDVLDLICRVGSIENECRSNFVCHLIHNLDSLDSSRMMLAPRDLPKLIVAGIAIGNHSYRHLPLTRISDPEDEIRLGMETICKLVGNVASASAFACPHGRYNTEILGAARRAGARLVFTSDPVLNLAEDGFLNEMQPIGRIPVSASALIDRAGRLDRSAVGAWLWRRPLGLSTELKS